MTVKRGRGDGSGETGVRSFRCPQDEWAATKAVAARRGDVLSDVIRAALATYRTENEGAPMTDQIDPIRRMDFTITHASGAEVFGQFTTSAASGGEVTWSLNGNPSREDAALTVDLRMVIEKIIAVYNRDGDEAMPGLLNL